MSMSTLQIKTSLVALAPHLKPVGQTPIFEINLETVNKAMNEIIQENLQEDKNR